MFHVWDDHVSVENEVYMENKNKFYRNLIKKFGIASKEELHEYSTYTTTLMQRLPNIFALFPTSQPTLESGERGIRGATLTCEKKNAAIHSNKLNAFQK